MWEKHERSQFVFFEQPTMMIGGRIFKQKPKRETLFLDNLNAEMGRYFGNDSRI
jgi:hypothetical protein